MYQIKFSLRKCTKLHSVGFSPEENVNVWSVKKQPSGEKSSTIKTKCLSVSFMKWISTAVRNVRHTYRAPEVLKDFTPVGRGQNKILTVTFKITTCYDIKSTRYLQHTFTSYSARSESYSESRGAYFVETRC